MAGPHWSRDLKLKMKAFVDLNVKANFLWEDFFSLLKARKFQASRAEAVLNQALVARITHERWVTLYWNKT